MIAQLLHGEGIYLLGLRLALLNAKDIGVLRLQPIEQTLIDGGADAVEVITDYLHRMIIFSVECWRFTIYKPLGSGVLRRTGVPVMVYIATTGFSPDISISSMPSTASGER